MSERTLTDEFTGAVDELQRYLCDEMAPMMVSDSVRFLMEQPPDLVAPQIFAWVQSQYSRGDSRYSTSDYIYHALKKIHLIGEFHLIDAQHLRECLQKLEEPLLEFCPEGDRGKLRQQIAQLGNSVANLTSAPVERIYQAAGTRATTPEPGPSTAGRPGQGADDAIGRGLRRLSLLLERMGSGGAVGLQGSVSSEMEQVQMQALVTAAVQARDEAELQAHLRRLGGAGIDARSEQLFRLLSRSLPAWNLPLGPGAAGNAYSNRSMEAMRKMVALAETPQEWARRFNDLVQAAIEQFNEGALTRAATMLDLAEEMLAGKNHPVEVVEAIRRRAHEAIKEDQLKKYAEKPEERQGLLRFMNFFSAMTVEGLLRQLNGESKRERRWLILLLLEAHGSKARDAALKELDEFLRGDKSEPKGFHQRNLVYLLRRIPPGEAGPGEKELEALARLTKLDQPPILVRESVRTLGQLRGPAAERTLLNRLREFEAMALRQAPSPEGKPHPILELLDSLCGALAVQRTEGASIAVVQHALREEPALGDAAARLDVLGSQDLSGFPKIVEGLLQTLRDRLPKKILGLVIQKRERLPHLIRALAGTPLPAVRAMLEEIASKYASQDLGTEAAKALETAKAAARRVDQAPPGLSGDIGLFGLPNLFQSLSDSRVTGILTLRKEHGMTCGAIHFRDGKIEASEYTHLKGEDALYQLFEKPEARSFDFRTEPAAAAGTPAAELTEVVPILLEAMRRHDELQQARALVPDGASLRTTTTKPKRHEEEEDLNLTQAVWGKAATGSTPAQCETVIQADAYRIRRLLAHWVEGGALQIGTPAPAAASMPQRAPAATAS